MAPDISSCLFSTFWVVISLIQGLTSEEICQYARSGEALPICTSSNRTGSTLFIDTSMVPSNKDISCICSIDIDASVQSVHVGYKPSVASTSCGLQFNTGSYVFKCEESDLIKIVDKFSQLEFSKTPFAVNACFILFIDRDVPSSDDKRNATIRCYDRDGPPPMSQSTPLITKSDKSFHMTSDTSGSRVIVTSTTFLNLLTSSTETTSLVSDGQTNDKDEKSTTVMIAAVAGAVGACVILIVVVIVYCCCRRRKANTTTSHKHGYVNTTLNTEVTDNVVYNMDLPAVKNNANIQLNNLDSAYDNAEDVSYNTVNYTTDNTETTNLSSLKHEISDNDTGTYNTVDDVAEIPQKININTNKADAAVNPSYETLEDIADKTPDANDQSENARENNGLKETSDITYSVVDKSRSSEKLIQRQRPKQFEVAGTGDTYAVVDKTTSL